MASSDSQLNYVPAPQPAPSQSACLALSLTKSNKVFGGTGILKWIHLYRFPGGHRHLLEDKTQSTVHYQPQRLHWIINLWEQWKLRKQRRFSVKATGKISVQCLLCFSSVLLPSISTLTIKYATIDEVQNEICNWYDYLKHICRWPYIQYCNTTNLLS